MIMRMVPEYPDSHVADTAPAATAAPPADAAAAAFATLQSKLKYLAPEDIEQVEAAYVFARNAHQGQTRHSGAPYITHPVAVATLVAQWKLDARAVVAALLHDVMEDCGVGKKTIARHFGESVAELVDGLTKLDRLRFDTREEGQAESFRKMLLAMARDVRVILVKLADRTHNMRTLGYSPRHKWERISTETLQIYAPLAHRLGLNQIYRELQDLSFRHLHPWRYGVLTKAVARARQRRGDLIQRVQGEVEKALASGGLEARIAGRIKPLYSIYRKMRHKQLSFAHVSDLYGIRIILPERLDCYTALGLLHKLYKPIPGRFKDYIAIPKTNGYQSLHTTLVGPAQVNVEFQIRTEAMDIIAESGVAAHWLYKTQLDASVEQVDNPWLQSLLDIQQETRDATEFWENVRVDLFPDAVYVFTPTGDILALPRGATVIDFAYAIHSDMGDQTVAASVNEEPVPLRRELANGDVVEIITAPGTKPNPAWLGFARTGRARSKIRSHLKGLEQNQARELGLQLLLQALRAEGLSELPEADERYRIIWQELLVFTGNRSRDELLSDIGLGKRSAVMVAEQLRTMLMHEGVESDAVLLSQARFTAHENLSQGVMMVDGSENASIIYASCCHPIPGDALLGYLARGEGLVIHTSDCAVAQRQRSKDPERFINVIWADEPVRLFDVGLIATITNGKGVLARVASTLAGADADIVHVAMTDEAAPQTLDLRFIVALRDRDHLARTLHALRRTPSVLRATRAKPSAH